MRPYSLLLHPENVRNIREESKAVFCANCGNRLGMFVDEKEPNFVVELFKDRISIDKKPFYSTTKRLITQLLDCYRQK